MEHRRMTSEQMTSGRDWESVALPIAMILTGLVLVGGDLVGLLSLDRIQNCWPMALIAIGVMELFAPSRGQRI